MSRTKYINEVEKSNDSGWEAVVVMSLGIDEQTDYVSIRLPKEIMSVIHDYCAKKIANTVSDRASTLSYVERKMFRIELHWAPLDGLQIEDIKSIAAELCIKQDGPFGA